jgi:HD-like signal output (HDOD) protein
MATYSSSMISEFSAQSAAFRFVALLAAEVSNGQVDLPAFPEVVARVKSALSKEDVTPVMIARVVASEAGLAARLMTMANSAIMNPSGTPVTELKTAIVRIGYNNVRTTAVAYAVSKLRQAEELQPIRKELALLWNEATMTATLAWAIARRVPGINPDEAMLAGLVHNIGKVYILSRSQRMAGGAFNVADITAIVRDWHANVGRAIVENWGFAPNIVVAVGEQDETDRVPRLADMGDVLQAAVRLFQSGIDEQGVLQETGLHKVGVFVRLSLEQSKIQQIAQEAAQAITTLRSALDG